MRWCLPTLNDRLTVMLLTAQRRRRGMHDAVARRGPANRLVDDPRRNRPKTRTRTACLNVHGAGSPEAGATADNRDDRYVFSNHRCSCEVARAKKAAAILCKGGVSFQFRAHDLRRTAASYMGEAGVDRFHIAHVLNHRSVTHSTAIYDRYRYDKEKRAAIEKWAEVLTRIVDVKPAPTEAPARHAAAGRLRSSSVVTSSVPAV